MNHVVEDDNDWEDDDWEDDDTLVGQNVNESEWKVVVDVTIRLGKEIFVKCLRQVEDDLIMETKYKPTRAKLVKQTEQYEQTKVKKYRWRAEQKGKTKTQRILRFFFRIRTVRCCNLPLLVPVFGIPSRSTCKAPVPS